MSENTFSQPIGAPLTTTLPRPLPPHRSFSGRTCRLMPTGIDHAPALFAAFVAASDNEDWTYLPYGPFTRQDAFADWLSNACLGTDPQFYTVFDPDGTALGLASLMRIDPAFGVIEVGNIHFSRKLQRSPASTEAIFLLMSHIFDDLGYRRFEWKCDALNAPSRRAAERFGFEYEGTFRQHMSYKGRNRDTAWFALLDGDWPAQKERFTRWLDPANFDATGQQLRPLARR
ncbi:GNAT family N-acetyltransferase [Rhodobacteraceae bacterium D3-12]|nr:GNAT family N-acetyltransferase [Rhodobacteraceae bacterium D3-12]